MGIHDRFNPYSKVIQVTDLSQRYVLIHVIRSLSTLDLYLDLMKALLNSYNVENCLRVHSKTAASYVVCVMA